MRVGPGLFDDHAERAELESLSDRELLRNAPLNKFHSDASSNDAPCGGTQEKTTRASRTSAAGQRLLATSNASDGKAIEGACRLPSAGP
jgi:hypothetical protein